MSETAKNSLQSWSLLFYQRGTVTTAAFFLLFLAETSLTVASRLHKQKEQNLRDEDAMQGVFVYIVTRL